MLEGVKGIYFDFGNVMGYPKPDIEDKNLYLNWDGIKGIVENRVLSKHLKKDVGLKEIECFFTNEIYNVFIKHEATDLVDPKCYNILLNKLSSLFNCEINEEFVDSILMEVNTMDYLNIYPNASYILGNLKNKGYCLSMISNMMLPGKLLLKKLSENNILHYFNTVTISSDIGFIKPRKEIFLKTLENDILKPEQVVFVGDTYNQDIIGAKNAGMHTIWLNCRHESVRDKWAADYEIQILEQLNKLL